MRDYAFLGCTRGNTGTNTKSPFLLILLATYRQRDPQSLH